MMITRYEVYNAHVYLFQTRYAMVGQHVGTLPPVPGHHIFLEQIQALLARGLVACQRRRRQRQGVLLDPLVELVANHLRVCV